MPDNRQELRTKLKNKLRELFQFNVSDLDFGIYRILNHKRDEIEEFIEQDLLNAIDEGLEEYQKEDASKYEDQLREAKNNIPDNAFDDDGNIKEDFKEFPDVKKYVEAKQALASLSVGEQIEKRIYQDLYTFFNRYYDDGDFLTQRRISTRDSKYAIPYNGEEVKLHWANKDQYYIKTGEHFANYKFEANGLDVWFKVQEAEVEKDNVKESDTRYFVLRQDDPIKIDEENDTLTLWFEYKVPADEETNRWLEVYNSVEKSRKTMDRQTFCTAFDEYVRSNVAGRWRDALSTMPDDKEHSLLYEKLNHFTAKNTTDYFIHKNLQEFLERELEYYLKHEVIQVDDFIKADSEQPLQTALTRAKVVRGIAEKVITFLSQIEDFQKKLFEKKKFVVDTHYCVTLDKVPEELYETILENEEQLEYWEDCYGMDQWEQNLEWNGEWTEAVLKSHPYIMVDTQFFDNDFKYELLASIDYLDEELGGLLVNGENFQAVNLLSKKYRGKIKSTYLDPPYNTSASEILYKNSFKHSSWLALIENRLVQGDSLLKEDGILCITIDDVEYHRLYALLKNLYGEENIAGVSAIKNNPSGRSTVTGFSISHEYAIFILKSKKSSVGRLERSKSQKERYDEEDKKGRFEWVNFRKHGGTRDESPKMFYPIYITDSEIRVPEMEWEEGKQEWETQEDPRDDEKVVYPIDDNDQQRRWKWGIDRFLENPDEFSVREDVHGDKTVYMKARMNEEGILPPTIWDKTKYSSTAYGTNLLKKLFKELGAFSYPKSIHAVEDSLRVADLGPNDIALDYFAGSGTTGHAVLNFNKEDDGKRKYVLVEMGKYFNTVLKPRLQKVVFSDNWKDGIPQDKDGQSHAFKYHFIESYEDALNNIDFKKKDDVQQAMEFDDYLLKYMLDFETKGVSATLLKDEAFETPFDYELNIQRGHESPAPSTVDLVETFHYLIGLWVQTLRRYEHQGRKYIISQGEIRDEDAIEDVLVVWRNTEDLDLDKEAEWVTEEIIGDQTFDRIYVNGASKIKSAEPTEITFREKMFEGVA